MSHEDRILIKQLRIKGHRSGKPWGVKRLQLICFVCAVLLNWLSYVMFLFYFLLLKVRHAISSPKISNNLKTKKNLTTIYSRFPSDD